jgi:hypothetical protein
VDRRSDCERRVLAEHAGSENALFHRGGHILGSLFYTSF